MGNDIHWLSYIDKPGIKTYESLLAVNICTIAKLVTIPDTKLSPICGIKKIVEKSSKAKPGICPFVIIDHCRHNNPYKSKYGAEWRDVIIIATSIKPLYTVANMVTFIMPESA